MARLRPEPGSSTAKQRQMLHRIKRRHGWTDGELHSAIGVPSTKLLSASDASSHIHRLSGMKLTNPPGCKPAPYAGRKATPGVRRMIADGHIEQIERLLDENFDDATAGVAWLSKTFNVEHPRELLTAASAGQVIRVLKDMLARRRDDGAVTTR